MTKKLQLIIKNAFYYANDTFLHGHILVDAGKIIALTHELPDLEAENVIDASKLHVLPGIVD